MLTLFIHILIDFCERLLPLSYNCLKTSGLQHPVINVVVRLPSLPFYEIKLWVEQVAHLEVVDTLNHDSCSSAPTHKVIIPVTKKNILLNWKVYTTIKGCMSKVKSTSSKLYDAYDKNEQRRLSCLMCSCL